jgi:hypothetical protein
VTGNGNADHRLVGEGRLRSKFSDDNAAWLAYASHMAGNLAMKKRGAGQTGPADEQAQHVNPAATDAAASEAYGDQVSPQICCVE